MIQKGLATDPDQLSSNGSTLSSLRAYTDEKLRLTPSLDQNAEASMLIASLREVIHTQAQELETLRQQLQQASKVKPPPPAPAPAPAVNKAEVRSDHCRPSFLHGANGQLQVEALQQEITALKVQVREAEEKSRETEKEQEDLLVLLDELNSKRRKDKQKMKEKGLDVSEDEDAEDDDEDDDE